LFNDPIVINVLINRHREKSLLGKYILKDSFFSWDLFLFEHKRIINAL